MGVFSVVLLVLLMLCNSGLLGIIASGFFNFTRDTTTTTADSSSTTTTTTNVDLEQDKRGIPTGAKPLHNR